MFLVRRLFDMAVEEVIGEDNTSDRRQFVGLCGQAEWYNTKHAKTDASRLHVRPTVRVRGTQKSPESIVFGRVWMLAEAEGADAVVVLQDSDNDFELLRAAKVKSSEHVDGVPLPAFGVAHRDAEGWLLASYRPQNAQEKTRIANATRVLFFDPTREPERLTAQPNGADTDAKRVCAYILGTGSGLSGKGRAPSRPPSDEQLAGMLPGLALGRALAAHKACGVLDFLTAVRTVASRLFPQTPAVGTG